MLVAALAAPFHDFAAPYVPAWADALALVVATSR